MFRWQAKATKNLINFASVAALVICSWCPAAFGGNTSANVKTTTQHNDCKHDDDSFSCVQYLSNYDGDTIKFTIADVHPLIGKEVSVRIREIDTAEIRGSKKGSCQKEAALKAKELVEKTMHGAKRIHLERCSRGKYFRLVCDVLFDDGNASKSLAKLLVTTHLAVPYDGSSKPKTDWCGMLKKQSLAH